MHPYFVLLFVFVTGFVTGVIIRGAMPNNKVGVILLQDQTCSSICFFFLTNYNVPVVSSVGFTVLLW